MILPMLIQLVSLVIAVPRFTHASDPHRSSGASPKLASRAPSFNYNTQKVRGVNLGGWLVTEPWINPSLYKYGNSAVDEYTLCQYLGKSNATRILKQHWNTWITQTDMQAISEAGLNHVRIPIGYWAYDVSGGEPYVQGQRVYVKKAIGWAVQYGIQVVIDLHGAPGSQNGFDNSGRRGSIRWPYNSSNIQRTYKVHQQLVEEFGNVTGVAAIQPINEPAGFVNDGGRLVGVTKNYYQEAYTVTRRKSSSVILSLHDAFLDLYTWSNFMPYPSYQHVSLDTHIYSVFTNDLIAMTFGERVAFYCDMAKYVEASHQKIWTWVGEWSPAITDCAPRLNGQGMGARYDGTYPESSKIGSCSGKSKSALQFSASYKIQLRKSFEVQTTVYENAGGWIMWAWKTERADDWSYKAGLQNGWIPQNPTSKLYGNQC